MASFILSYFLYALKHVVKVSNQIFSLKFISNKGNLWKFVNLQQNKSTSEWLGYIYDGNFTKYFLFIGLEKILDCE